MNDELFEWDDANILHLAEHGVAPEEAEDVILGDPLEFGFEVVDGEARWAFVGETSELRILRVVISVRGGRMRVVTAFKPSARSRLLYLKKKAGEQ
jgi:uncharacterized DUF497 family protein